MKTKMKNSDSCSELESHANMIVLGKHCYIISSSGRHAEVNAFAREVVRNKSVPIFDAAIVYNCRYSMKMYLLIVINALYVQSMTNNLILQFIMIKAGLEVRQIPKIHIKEPTMEYHSIYFLDSSFPTRRPTTKKFIDGIPVLITTEGPTWNPH